MTMPPADHIPVTTYLPSQTHARIARAASRNGVTMAQLVAELVRRGLVASAPPRRKPTRNEASATRKRAREVEKLKLQEERASRLKRIETLHAKGWSDSRIAADIGLSQPTTSRLRRELNLEPHFTSPNTKR